MKSAIFTIAAKNYLPCVRVLMASIRKWHPEVLRVVILVDKIDGHFNPENEDFDIVLSEDLNLPQSDWFHFKYTILELSTAVKPYAFEFLLRKYNLDRLIYLDPDIKIYSRLDCLLHSLERCSILLTPHLTGTLDDGRHPGELDILRSGSYNLGFIGLSFTEESQRFLKWWQARLYEHCVVDLDRGLFVDQRWVDLVPGLFSGVVIDRRPGLNVAYWNLAHRRVLEESGRFTVNGEPLYFFHFSGFDAENPMQFSKHQNRFRLSDLGDAALIVAEYRDELLAQGYQQCRHWPYAYGQFENGFPIPDMGRPIHHESPRLLEEIADPFSDEGLRAFLTVWNGPIDGPGGQQPGVTRLAYRIYRSRYDVQAVMPDVLGPDRVQFLEWMLSSGKREHRLNEVFLAPVWDALEAAQRSQTSNKGAGRPSKLWSSRNAMTGLDEAVGHAGGADARERQKAVWQHLSEESQNALVEDDCGPGAVRLTGLTRAVYESRADLQRIYPNLTGETGVRLLIWILTYGKREYGLDAASLEPLRQQWKPSLLFTDKPLVRFRYRLLLAATKVSIRLRTSASFIPLRFSRLKASWYLWKYSQRISRHDGRPANASVPHSYPAPLSADAPKSVNLIGYVRSEMGVGESARLAALAARSAGILVRLRSVDEEGPYRRLDDRAGPVSETSDGYFSIFHVNADQTPSVFARLIDHSHADKYNIGYWAWELSEFPDRWAASFQYYQEIWTPSSFCQSALAPKSPIPVVRIPHAVRVDDVSSLSRADFGLGAEEFVFLAFCDMLSVFERKNPIGVAEAFIREFGTSAKCRLVMKVNHGDERPEQLRRLTNLCSGYPISIVNRTIARDEVNALIGLIDCVVSLHRSEGFGLTLAEAMYLGKPVIATAYSGNMDFTNPANSFLVDFKLRAVGSGCEPYDPDQLWADPDLESACAQMRAVFEDAALRDRKAMAGKEFVDRFLSPEAVGAQMKRRLELIAETSLGRREHRD